MFTRFLMLADRPTLFWMPEITRYRDVDQRHFGHAGAWHAIGFGFDQCYRTLTSVTLVTPALGTPASGVLTNCSGTAASLTAGHVTTNANLTGVITFSGNTTSIASQTGTGTKFVVDTSPTLVTPTIGAATATSITFGGATFSTYATGSWTPSDQSGASLSFSVTTAKYVKIGNVVFIECFITFPSTASGATNQIRTLPFSVDDDGPTAVIRASAGVAGVIKSLAGTTNFQIVNATTGVALVNSAITTAQITFLDFISMLKKELLPCHDFETSPQKILSSAGLCLASVIGAHATDVAYTGTFQGTEGPASVSGGTTNKTYTRDMNTTGDRVSVQIVASTY